MATDVWQNSARYDKIHLCNCKSSDEWEDAVVLYEVSFSEASTSESCISNIIKPLRTSVLTTANHIPPAVSMVTVALDCYCSNSTTGNSLQPWSLGGKTHIRARVVQKSKEWESDQRNVKLISAV